ncbi:transcriptional regulator (plasmid) [Rhodococcus erythropolis R138]|nr:transcriptional regulator [Rhodococcus erythropolis R138]
MTAQRSVDYSHFGQVEDAAVRGGVVTARITEGVFFTTPPDLPRGRHELSREDVLTAQRERLMIATTELMAESGYQGVGVRQIAKRAKISPAAFYECFPDKDACVFAAYGRFIEVLLTRIREILPVGTFAWDRNAISDIVEGYLSALNADPVVARAFQVEMDALGRRARKQRRAALVGMSEVLKAERERAPGNPRVPLSAYVGAVYAIRQLASDALDEPGSGSIESLSVEAGVWVEAMLSAVSH